MKHIFLTLLLIFTVLGIFASGRLPVSACGYIENKGQIVDQHHVLNKDVKYLYQSNVLNIQLKANGFSYDTYYCETKSLTKTENHNLALANKDPLYDEDSVCHFQRIDVEFVGSNPTPQILAEQPSAYYKNFYTTGTSEDGVLNVRTYGSVTYKNLYPGIDLQFVIDKDNKAKYNYIIHPGADPSLIQWRYKGAGDITCTKDKMILGLKKGIIEESIPMSFIKESTTRIDVGYTASDLQVFSFLIPEYNRIQTLVIDPAPWATYFGGNGTDYAYDVTLDDLQSILITGATTSTANMATTGSHQVIYGTGSYDAFIAKLTPSGTTIWATYYGGSDDDKGRSITRDANNNVIIVGTTVSTNNIATTGAFKTTKAGSKDAFIVKLNASGTRIWGTYFGGNYDDQGEGIAIDADSNIIIIGTTSSSANISSTGAHQTSLGGIYPMDFDAFIAKFNAQGVRQWSTYYGGTENDYGSGIVINQNRDIFLSGQTRSLNNISTPGSYQPALYSSFDCFLVKFNSGGIRQWGTYYGGNSEDSPTDLAMDIDENLIIAGQTNSSTGFALLPGSYKGYSGGFFFDGFLGKFNPAGVLIWDTYFGGNNNEWGGLITTDLINKNIFVFGNTKSAADIATPGAYQSLYSGGSTYGDMFLLKFSPSGSRLWGTYYGGPGDDYGSGVSWSSSGNVVVAGFTNSTSGIALPGAPNSTLSSFYDCVVASFPDNVALPVSLISFEAQKQGNSVLLEWKTASEINNNHFEIERSEDKDHWHKIGRVSGNGTLSCPTRYFYTDFSPLDRLVYYRLKQVDTDGNHQYSSIITVYSDDVLSGISIYPNPGNQIITIDGLTEAAKLYDTMGIEVMEIDHNGDFNIADLPNGLYFVKSGATGFKLIKTN
jgi:hypothetical protein